MKTIISSIELAFIIVEIVQFHLIVKRIFGIHKARRVKPFDCITCLSFWVCIGMLFVPYTIIDKIFIVTSATIIAYLLSSYITEKKLK